jgi:hypothetical protein
MRNSLLPALDVSEYLNEGHIETLSPNAQKVYCAVAYLLKDRNATEIWLDDAQVSRRARVLIQFIGSAQSELARAGLLHLVPGDNQTKYALAYADEFGA